LTYEDIFYRQLSPQRERERDGRIYGFPQVKGTWCQAGLKRAALTGSRVCASRGATGSSNAPLAKPEHDGRKINIVHYVGIAADEPKRIAKHMPKKDKVLPLVQMGWDEALCGLEATYMDMLSPAYTDGKLRDGCWFCHNQSVDSLRRLRHDYPDLWALLMKWDNDSPVTYHPDGHTVHDFDKRFQMEDEMLIDPTEPFFWKMLDEERNYMMKL